MSEGARKSSKIARTTAAQNKNASFKPLKFSKDGNKKMCLTSFGATLLKLLAAKHVRLPVPCAGVDVLPIMELVPVAVSFRR